MKKVLAFDLDGTLAESKSAITDEMSDLLSQLLHTFQICVISGGKFGQFESQLINNLKASSKELENLHLMPTSGTRYDKYNPQQKTWDEVYAENFTEDEKKRIISALEEGAESLGYKPEKTWGDIIEDRGSQITWSALGQQAPSKEKHDWDPDHSKKKALRDFAASKLPGFNVRTGGTTSVDITKEGIDKAYGMKKLIEILGIEKQDILFFGDAIYEGGNDLAVKEMGIDSVQVRDFDETARILQSILYLVS